MKTSPFAIFRRIYVVIFLLIALLGLMFTGITYMATTNFYETSTQLLNRDVAAHIAKFTSPYGREGFDRRKADSVFYEAMVISPSAEVYFLDTAGRVIYFHAHPGEVKSRQIPLDHILRYLRSKGMQHIDGPDPRDPGHPKIFSAAAVEGDSGRLGYIYVVLGSAQYRSVTQMLYDSAVTPAVLGTAAAILIPIPGFVAPSSPPRRRTCPPIILSGPYSAAPANFPAPLTKNFLSKATGQAGSQFCSISTPTIATAR